jgi:hypothetical protein
MRVVLPQTVIGVVTGMKIALAATLKNVRSMLNSTSSLKKGRLESGRPHQAESG